MQGHKQFTDKVVLRFRLSERVPRHTLYRRLNELLDWAFFRSRRRPSTATRVSTRWTLLSFSS
jgi:hypothetical protein